MINNEIRKRIEEKFGCPLENISQSRELANDIQAETGSYISIATIRSMFGWVSDADVKPHNSTLDIIARYLGYPNFRLLEADMGEDCEISAFTPVESVESANLEVGTQLRITYNPRRVITLTYLGENRFSIAVVDGSKKLQADDILTITHIAVGFELLVSDVKRGNDSLGSYHAAKQGGITSIEIM